MELCCLAAQLKAVSTISECLSSAKTFGSQRECEKSRFGCKLCGGSRSPCFVRLGDLAQHVRSQHPGSCVRQAITDTVNLDQHVPVIVHEEDAFVVCIKPAGITTHSFGHSDGMNVLTQPSGLTSLQPVHRLDSDTAGCVVLAKTQDALRALTKAFASRSVTKHYKAIVCGDFPKAVSAKHGISEGIIDYSIGGKPSVTNYKVLARDPSITHGVVTTLHLIPHTGRNHQLRKHLSALNHPIVGDRIYRNRTSLACATRHGKPSSLLLWAFKIVLPHPQHPYASVTVCAENEPPSFQLYREHEHP